MPNFSSSALKAALLVAIPGLLTGCANNFQTTAHSGPSLLMNSIKGNLHGGQSPIVGATVKLYAAGTTGYGSAGTLLATTTSAGDSSFGFTQVSTPTDGTTNSYACPSANSEIYIIGSGGNTQGNGGTAVANNAASVLIAAVGLCSNQSNIFVNINEVTTVASVFALQQYMNPTAGPNGAFTIGTASDYTVATPTQSGQGLINQFALVPKLVDFPSGVATASFTGTSTTASVAAVTVTATPESTKINTIADILSACVNQPDNSTTSTVNGTTTATSCGTLFTNATPPTNTYTSQTTATFNTAVDTLQSTYYMATNPTDGSATNLGNLFALATPKSPFQSTISYTPSDWTIGIAYTSNLTTGTTTTNTACSNGAPFINYSYQLAVDGSGNVWMGNGGSAATEALTYMSPLGVPLGCSGAIAGSRGMTIDSNGNGWATSNSSTSLVKYDGTTTTTTYTAAGGNGYGITADGKGNVFFDEVSTGFLYEVPSGSASTVAPTKLCSTSTGGNVVGPSIDSKGTIYAPYNKSTTSTVYTCTPSTTGVYPTTASASQGAAATIVSANSSAIDASGSAIITNSSSTSSTYATSTNTIAKLVPTYSTSGTTQTVTYAASTVATPQSAGLQTPRQVVIDGAGNIWTADNNPNNNGGNANATIATELYGISEIAKDGTALSPTVIQSSTTQTGGFLKTPAYFNAPRGIAVDFSGNVWVSQTTSSASTTSITTEIIGAAVPAITPVAIQVKNASYGTKP